MDYESSPDANCPLNSGLAMLVFGISRKLLRRLADYNVTWGLPVGRVNGLYCAKWEVGCLNLMRGVCGTREYVSG